MHALRLFICLFPSYICFMKGSNDHIYTTSSKFLDVVKTRAFVDKSLLVKAIFEGPKKKLITAPRKFGKSTNLDMMRLFYKTHENGSAVNHTYVRKVFEKLKIHGEKQFFDDNFGKHPVVFVRFKGEAVQSWSHALGIFKREIHTSFVENKFVCKSEKLREDQRKLCRAWCDDFEFRSMKYKMVKVALYNLTSFLCQYYNKKVLVFVDEYDALMRNAIVNLRHDGLRKTIDYITEILRELIKDDSYLQVVVLSGISNVAGSGILEYDVDQYKFLRPHEMVEFYGFTGKDVDMLFSNSKFNVSEKVDSALDWYGAYWTKSKKRIYSPYSVLGFIENRQVQSYWRKNQQVVALGGALTNKFIRLKVFALLRSESIHFKFVRNCSEYLAEIKDLHEYKRAKKNSSEVFFTFMFEQGYLSFGNTGVVIPNKEVKTEYANKLEDYFVENCDLNDEEFHNCQEFLRESVFTGGSISPKRVEGFHKDLLQMIKSYRKSPCRETVMLGRKPKNEADHYFPEYVAFFMTARLCDFNVDSRAYHPSRLDLTLKKGNSIIIIVLQYDFKSLPESKMVLRKVLNEHKVNKTNNQDNMNQLFVTVGLDNSATLSISCLLNSWNITEAVHVLA